MRLVYGLDTGSIEDFSQCAIIDVPDDWDEETFLEEVEAGNLPMTMLPDLVDENVYLFSLCVKLQSQLLKAQAKD